MKILFISLTMVVLGCTQTHDYKLEWNYSAAYDINHYKVYLGESVDNLEFMGDVEHSSLMLLDSTIARYTFESIIDGHYVFGSVIAVDDSLNQTAMSEITSYKKNDEFPPVFNGAPRIRR